MSSTIAVIGLGRMGGAIAVRLLSTGHRVIGSDPSATAREAAVNAGVEVVETAAAAVSQVDIVTSSLPTPAVVQSLWIAGDLIGRMPAGSTLIETSTVDPATMLAVAAAARPNVHIIDAAVSGGPAQALEGTLMLFVGADDGAFEAGGDVLKIIGVPTRVGAPGAGKSVKLVNNMMSMSHIVVAAEAFALGVAAGVDPDRPFEVISASAGSSVQFERRFARAIRDDFSPHFALSLARKDLTLGVEFAQVLGVEAPMASLARSRYLAAEDAGLGGEDAVAVLKVYSPEPATDRR